MPAAVAIPAAVSLGSSVLGGVLGSRASKKAGDIQSAAATKAGADLKEQLDIYNPKIGAAADTAAGNVNTATAAGQEGITGAVGAGQGRIDESTRRAMELLQPYIGAGGTSLTQLMTAMGPGGDLSKTFTAADMHDYDPGYAFRMDQASKALQGSQAARGGSLGGGAAAALVGLNQNLASAEFGNAEARFRAQQNDRFGRLNSLVNLGASSADKAAGYGMSGADMASRLGLTGATSSADLGYRGAIGAGGFQTDAAKAMADNALRTQGTIGDWMTGGAAARAAGGVGSASAWGSALGGVANTANQVGKYYQDKDTMDEANQRGGGYGGNPAVSPYYSGGSYNPNTGVYTVQRTKR